MCIRDRLHGDAVFQQQTGAAVTQVVEADGPKPVALEQCGQGRADVAPVSYTHLDVYKRQFQCPPCHFGGADDQRHRPMVDIFLHGVLLSVLDPSIHPSKPATARSSCLLYTSRCV